MKSESTEKGTCKVKIQCACLVGGRAGQNAQLSLMRGNSFRNTEELLEEGQRGPLKKPGEVAL